mmetsp:Transcript_55001/g.148184  ORF Transcript_55001/g.148184 Transcript_55001/m.148184 type:complete len:81 (+) Transcript_55001:500-742(+)
MPGADDGDAGFPAEWGPVVGWPPERLPELDRTAFCCFARRSCEAIGELGSEEPSPNRYPAAAAAAAASPCDGHTGAQGEG